MLLLGFPRTLDHLRKKETRSKNNPIHAGRAKLVQAQNVAHLVDGEGDEVVDEDYGLDHAEEEIDHGHGERWRRQVSQWESESI
jgi:hypothetical protein